MIDLVVPEVGESITEVMVASWLVEEGEYVERDKPVVELESDKATIELPSPEAGVISQIVEAEGATVKIGGLLARLDTQAKPVTDKPIAAETQIAKPENTPSREVAITPSAKRVLAEKGVDPAKVTGSGKGGMILKEDAVKAGSSEPGAGAQVNPQNDVIEEVVPLSPIRRTIAKRLLESQQSSAQLTTFNEIDMSAVIKLRTRYKQAYLDRYGVKLGFMSFFVKAAIEALKAYPSVNAEIRDDSIVYKNYYSIGVAVGGGKGLVVPVVRNAERMSFAEIEKTIGDFAVRGAQNKIGLDELAGGTFTISNGGVYGSLMATPILNPPQSGILGLHAIKDRPVVVNNEIVIRPMMNIALTYDHRIVDGRESVGFLIKVKEVIEDPARLFLEI